jgi:Helix-turn-helix domain of transposase family ISL3
VQWCPEATLLLGIPGLVVTRVTEDGDGGTAVHTETHPDLREQARECHGCGRRGTIKERPATEPRDVPRGTRMIRLHWRKMRLECMNPECPVITFTEWLPAVPPRARLTTRERDQIGADTGDDLLAVAAAARRHGVSERTAQAAFDDYAGEKLADLLEQTGPVKAAGLDEFRRGAARPASGNREARSEWFTHLVDLEGGGTLGLAQERTGAAGKSLVKDHEGTLRYLAMDLSAPYRRPRPARRLLPVVRRPRAHPRDQDPREHDRKMAAARHRRGPERLFERESRSAQPDRETRRPHRPRVREPRQPGPPRPHGHHPQCPPTITQSHRTALTTIISSNGQAAPETGSRPTNPG